MFRFLLLAGIATVSLASLPGAVLAQSLRDLTVVQNQAFEAGKPRPGSLSVLTLLDRADATYAIGETVRLRVKSSADAYVTVLNIGASGRVTQLFPNSAQPDNRVRGGEAIEIPSAQSGARIAVSGPVGAELIKVIATSKPLTVIREDHLQGNGVFRTLNGDVEGLKRDLTVVTENAPPEVDVAVGNQIIKTIPANAAVGSQGPILPAPGNFQNLVAPGGQSAILPVAGAPASGFPLLLAADRPAYRAGEKLVLAVTTLESCFLSVHSINSNGQLRQLFPTSALPVNQIGALQTVMISGGPSPQSVVATGPAIETITAYCTREPRSVGTIRSANETASSEIKNELDRDLALIAGRPIGGIGYAQITISVTP